MNGIKTLCPLLLFLLSLTHLSCIKTDTKEREQKTEKVGSLEWVNFDTGANVKTLAFEGDLLWMGLPSGVISYDTRTKDKHVIYTPESTGGGLVSKGIYIIKVDDKGDKWIGTYGGGLVKFDGKGWKRYTPAEGLGDLWVYDIVFDKKDGKMWVATWKGVSVFDGKGFRNYTEADGLIDKWVYAIGLDKDGIFWFGTEAGVNSFDGREWKTYTHKDGLGADVAEGEAAVPNKNQFNTASGIDQEGYGSDAPGRGRHHATAEKRNVGPNPNFVISAAVDNNNNKWFGTWGAGLSKFDGKTWRTFTKKDGLGGNFIHALAFEQDGTLWAGTDGGASWYDGESWKTYSKRDGLLDDNVFSIAFDSGGNKWFGTWTGLSKLVKR